jgi:long-chain acyl-CoA synthetase
MRAERLFPEIASLVRLASYQHAEREAFVTFLPSGAQGQVSFLEVDEYSAAFSAYLLRSLGLRKGDRVAIHLPNCLAYPICALGVLRAGLVLVNVNPLFSERQLVEVLRDSGARVLVAPDFHAQKLERVLGLTAVRALVTASVAEFFPFWSRALVGIGFRFRGSQNPQDKRVIKLRHALEFGMSHENWSHGSEVTPSPYDVAMFQYTGGTTGVSKAAMLTHSNIAVAVSQIVGSLEHRVESGRDSLLTTIPFSNSFAFVMNFLSFYWMGAKNILVPFSRPLHNLRGVIAEHKVSWMVGAPNFYRSLLGESWFSRRPPLSLKAALSVGMSLQRDIAEDFVYLTGAPLVEGYGLAEACSVVTLNSLRGGSVFTNSVGVPLGHTELNVVDANGKSVGPGIEGELVVRGAQVMVGYWNRPSVTSRVLRDGWLYTGDLAQLLEDGSYRVLGRKTCDHSFSQEHFSSEKSVDQRVGEFPEEANPFVGV